MSASRLTLLRRCRSILPWCCGAWTSAPSGMTCLSLRPISPFRFWEPCTAMCHPVWRGRANTVSDGLALTPTELGPPALADSLAIFECSRESTLEGGDHTILVGRVLRFSRSGQGAPLIFFRGDALAKPLLRLRAQHGFPDWPHGVEFAPRRFRCQSPFRNSFLPGTGFPPWAGLCHISFTQLSCSRRSPLRSEQCANMRGIKGDLW